MCWTPLYDINQKSSYKQPEVRTTEHSFYVVIVTVITTRNSERKETQHKILNRHHQNKIWG